MDNHHHQGDLTDIFRASLAGVTSSSSSPTSDQLPAPSDLSWHHHNHHFAFSDATANYVVADPRANAAFGDPFSNMRDPFLHDLDLPAANSSYFSNNASSNSAIDEVAAFAGSPAVLAQNLLEDHDMRIIRPPPVAAAGGGGGGGGCNSMFSSMIQISPGSINAVSPCDSTSPVNVLASPRGIKPPPAASAVVSGNMVDNAGGVQISSPRNPGLKRRKSQAKKVVCIPAPAAANSRPSSGEVVPSDLWAWRKYGQKPIKGSPHPRGYYRCSSSKGCSARKQVERSRTDPNMLVITYTSEHNHPWPTQRNALAGSTRSQPSKNNNNNNNNNNAASSKNNNAEAATTQPQNGASSKPKEEEEQQQQTDQSNSDVVSNRVKEEMEIMEDAEKHTDELENENNNNNMEDNNMNNGEFSDGSVLGYKPSMCEDFFAELGEIEADPLNLLFTQGFNEQQQQQQQRESKALDPFQLFDWSSSSGDHTTTTTTTSLEEPKRGL